MLQLLTLVHGSNRSPARLILGSIIEGMIRGLSNRTGATLVGLMEGCLLRVLEISSSLDALVHQAGQIICGCEYTILANRVTPILTGGEIPDLGERSLKE